MFRPVALLLAITAACGAAPSDDPFADGDKADRPNQLPLSVPEIESAARFRAVSFADGGLLVLGRSVKFLVDHRDKAHPVVHFVNANFPGGGDSSKFHFPFARAVLGVRDDLERFN